MNLSHFLSILFFVLTGPIGRLLNSKHLLPFSKMTYCFLLIHPIITRAVFLSSNSYLHLSSAFMVGFLYATRFLEVSPFFITNILLSAFNKILKYSIDHILLRFRHTHNGRKFYALPDISSTNGAAPSYRLQSYN